MIVITSSTNPSRFTSEGNQTRASIDVSSLIAAIAAARRSPFIPSGRSYYRISPTYKLLRCHHAFCGKSHHFTGHGFLQAGVTTGSSPSLKPLKSHCETPRAALNRLVVNPWLLCLQHLNRNRKRKQDLINSFKAYVYRNFPQFKAGTV